VPARGYIVSFTDPEGFRHSVEVQADGFYEAGGAGRAGIMKSRTAYPPLLCRIRGLWSARSQEVRVSSRRFGRNHGLSQKAVHLLDYVLTCVNETSVIGMIEFHNVRRWRIAPKCFDLPAPYIFQLAWLF